VAGGAVWASTGTAAIASINTNRFMPVSSACRPYRLLGRNRAADKRLDG
jgi:hypothetical protein